MVKNNDPITIRLVPARRNISEMQMSEVLRTGFEIITDHHTTTDCDGLMKTSDTHHGQYLVTFE